jgi:hypothetical protein
MNQFWHNTLTYINYVKTHINREPTLTYHTKNEQIATQHINFKLTLTRQTNCDTTNVIIFLGANFHQKAHKK